MDRTKGQPSFGIVFLLLTTGLLTTSLCAESIPHTVSPLAVISGRSGTRMRGGPEKKVVEKALASSVRISVKDSEGAVGIGSGTIIKSDNGKSQVLTCGHIFRRMPENFRIEVEYLDANGELVTHVGTLLGHNMDSDLGLIEFQNTEPKSFSAIVSKDFKISKGDEVFSIGSGAGVLPPKIENMRVLSQDRYEGPHNIQCTGMPLQGRSGGGLFDKDGALIGVTIAADEQSRHGFYTGHRAIVNFLESPGEKK